jgi:hypothetical protein
MLGYDKKKTKEPARRHIEPPLTVMIKRFIEKLKARRARLERETELGNIARATSRRTYPNEKFIWSQLILEDCEGIVIMLWYSSSTIPPRRRFWKITDAGPVEMDAITAKERFQLGPYR